MSKTINQATEKPPPNEPARLFWYVVRLEHFRSITSEQDKRRCWRWSSYQCLMVFAERHNAVLGFPGAYHVGANGRGRDTDIMGRARDQLVANGFDKSDITEAISTYFEKFKNDKWHRAKGWDCVAFQTALSGVIGEMRQTRDALNILRQRARPDPPCKEVFCDRRAVMATDLDGFNPGDEICHGDWKICTWGGDAMPDTFLRECEKKPDEGEDK